MSNGESAYFMSTNRNKRSLTLDVKTPEGGEIIRRLVNHTDIFVNNFPRLSSMQELGLDPESCLLRNAAADPRGDQRVRAHRPTRRAARLRHPGAGDERHHEPDRRTGRHAGALPVPISDMTVGVYALVAILAALYERERTGRGQAIDAAILEAQMTWLCPTAGSSFATEQNPARLGNQHPTITPTNLSRPPTAISSSRAAPIASGPDCSVLGLPDAVRDDPKFATNPQRNRNRAEVVAWSASA